jgi:hypothetical protein
VTLDADSAGNCGAHHRQLVILRNTFGRSMEPAPDNIFG